MTTPFFHNKVVFYPTNYRANSRVLFFGGTWVAQSVKCQTLSFGSGHDLTVGEFQPYLALCASDMEPTWDSLSPSFCPTSTHAVSVSLKNK